MKNHPGSTSSDMPAPDVQAVWRLHERGTIPALLFDGAGHILGCNRSMQALACLGDIPHISRMAELLWPDDDRSRAEHFLGTIPSPDEEPPRFKTTITPPGQAPRKVEFVLHGLHPDGTGGFGILHAHDRGEVLPEPGERLYIDALMRHIPDHIFQGPGRTFHAGEPVAREVLRP